MFGDEPCSLISVVVVVVDDDDDADAKNCLYKMNTVVPRTPTLNQNGLVGMFNLAFA